MALLLTPGQAADITQAVPLLDQVEPEAFLADKGYDSDALIVTLEERGIMPVIPPKANRREPRKTDFALYCERNLVERFFCKLKQYRAISTRYDKLANTFLAAVALVCILFWLIASSTVRPQPGTTGSAGEFLTIYRRFPASLMVSRRSHVDNSAPWDRNPNGRKPRSAGSVDPGGAGGDRARSPATKGVGEAPKTTR